MSKSNGSTKGIGFPSLLGLTFIILKLCKVIDWSWWWVLCPFWIVIPIILFSVLFIIIAFITKAMNKK